MVAALSFGHPYLWVPIKGELLPAPSSCLHDQLKSHLNPPSLSGERSGSPHNQTSQKIWVCCLSQVTHIPLAFHPFQSCFSPTFVMTLNKMALLATFNPTYYVLLLEILSPLDSCGTFLDFYSCLCWLILGILWCFIVSLPSSNTGFPEASNVGSLPLYVLFRLSSTCKASVTYTM